MAAQLGGVPVLILKEGAQRTVGREAQRANIMAAKAIAETIRTALGPKGMDKMLVDSLGDVTITNDGATILDEVEVQHPAAKMMVEVAKAQDTEVGDGTTTAVILAGELLKYAEVFLDKNIHPTVIISGFKKAAEKVREVWEAMGVPVSIDDTETLKKVALTAMSGKAVAPVRDHFSKIAVDAVRQIAERREKGYVADIDNIQVVKKHGGSLAETQLIYGLIIDKEVVHPGMPKRVENPKIALLDCPLEIEKTEFDAEIRISDPAQLRAFQEKEEEILKAYVDKIKEVGANVVVCQKGIDDLAQHYLAKAGIMAARRAKKSDMEKLAKATEAKIITNINDLTEVDLGAAKLAEERKVADDRMVFIEGCKNPRAVSVLIRGGLERIVDEAERALHDAFCVVRNVIVDGRILAGGGAPEIEAAKKLREASIGGREQLAYEAFTNALEVIPKTLAENAGLDQLDVLVELRASHAKEGGQWYGIEVFSGKPMDMMNLGVLEPLNVKLQAVKSAVEAASMILRIDDIIASAKMEAKPPGAPPEGLEFD